MPKPTIVPTSEAPPEVRVEYMPLLALRGTPGNPKAHDLGGIKASIQRFGFTSPMLMNEVTGRIIAGHGRIEALILLRFSGVRTPDRIREIDGEWYVPVLRGVSFRNEAEAKAYLLGDNKLSELGGWNDAALAEMLREITADLGGDDLGKMLAGTGFDEKELAALMRGMEGDGAPKVGAIDPDDAVAPPAEPKAKLGDLFILGEHRLLCGDSCAPKQVARLMDGRTAVMMATDPPYGVDYTATKSGMPVGGLDDLQERWGDIANDALSPDELGVFLSKMFAAAGAHMTPTAAYYVWHPSGELNHVFRTAMRSAGLLVHRQIIWAKPSFVLTRSGMYHWSHEPCFYGWREGNTPPWYGEKNQRSVWAVGRDDGKAVHPTQKPIALFEIPMLNHSKRGEVCLELFSGSGSQIIAGERLERRVFAMELSPRWVDAAVARWEAFTGKRAVLAPAV
jgi:DNA modification methylase